MKVLMLLAMALPAVAQDSPRDRVESKLRNLRVTLDFRDAPLETVVDYLQEVSELNLFLDAKVRDRGLVVTLKVTDVSLRGALGLILKPHGCDTMIRDGVVRVMTREEVVDRTVVMQVYDCRDLVHPVPDFPGVDIDLGTAGRLVFNPADTVEAGEVPIEEWVRAHTGGRSWEENQKCVCRLTNGLLVVKNTPEVHQQVVRLLDLLRRSR
jgi:hypothetical protein